jgi:hypothetical protein
MVPTQRLSITDDRRTAPRPRVHVIHLRGRFTAATPREKGCRFTATTSAVHNRVSRPKAIATPRILAREESRTATRQRSSKQNQTNDDHGQQGDLRAHPIPQSRQDRIRHGLSVHRSARARLRTIEIDVACSITGWTEALHWSYAGASYRRLRAHGASEAPACHRG